MDVFDCMESGLGTMADDKDKESSSSDDVFDEQVCM